MAQEEAKALDEPVAARQVIQVNEPAPYETIERQHRDLDVDLVSEEVQSQAPSQR